MDINQYNQLCFSDDNPRVIKLSELQDQTPRTLAYGYTSTSETPSGHFTWHLYLNNRRQFVLIVYRYGYPDNIKEPELIYSYDEILSADEIFCDIPRDIQPQRLYPESCDYEVLKLLQYMGVELSFTTFNLVRYEKVKDLVYHGELDVNDRADSA